MVLCIALQYWVLFSVYMHITFLYCQRLFISICCSTANQSHNRVLAGGLQSRLRSHTAPAFDAHDAAMREWTQQRRTASADAHPLLAAVLYTRAATARVRQQAAAHRGSAAESSGAVHAAGAPLLLLARMLRGVPATVEPDSYMSGSFNEPNSSSSSSSSSRSTNCVHKRSSTRSSSDATNASIGDNRLSAEQQHSITAVAVADLLVQSRVLREQCNQTFAIINNNSSSSCCSSSTGSMNPTQQTDNTMQHYSDGSNNAVVISSSTAEQCDVSDSVSQRMTAQEAQQVLEQSQQLRADCVQAGLLGLVSAH
jgi:hypothetical protein